jgi:hypothetical protein
MAASQSLFQCYLSHADLFGSGVQILFNGQKTHRRDESPRLCIFTVAHAHAESYFHDEPDRQREAVASRDCGFF